MARLVPFVRMVATVVLAVAVTLPLMVKWLPPVVSTTLYSLLSAVCHQHAQESFWWLNAPMGACARCLGLYAGLGLLPLLDSRRRVGLWVITLAWLVIEKVILEITLGWYPPNALRLVSGAMVGWSVLQGVAWLQQQPWGKPARRVLSR
jgi:uncharacterized membrane protein